MTTHTMKEKINEEVLCVLRKDPTNQILIDYIDIVNPYKIIIDKLSDLCDSPETTIPQIASFIQNTKDFDQLTAHYRYCVSLRSAYQSFSVNNQDYINKFSQDHQLDNPIVIEQVVMMQIAQMWISVRGVQI